LTRIVDTTVVVKWFVAEAGQQAAEALIGQALVAPDLLMIEVSNAAWKKWKKREIGSEQAVYAQSLVGSFVELLPSQVFAASALQIALELSHPVYDCLYLAVAEAHGLRLITADERFIARCAGSRFTDVLVSLTDA
jgi:predicted nucleic acid-binding protein